MKKLDKETYESCQALLNGYKAQYSPWQHSVYIGVEKPGVDHGGWCDTHSCVDPIDLINALLEHIKKISENHNI